MTVAELIEARLQELGKSRGELRAELLRAGVRVSRQAIHAWYRGIARPTAAHVIALWDVLAVPTHDREAWMQAIARRSERSEPVESSW